MTDIVNQINDLFEEHGSAPCENSITIQDHSLHCARLAVTDEQGYSLIAACLLHDIGHLLYLHYSAFDLSQRDQHAERGADFLTGHFPDTVVEPIRLHVDAKRYLCAIDPNYYQDLPASSRKRLHAQGGLMTEAQREAFHQSPWSYDAIILRRYDDRAKTGLPLGLPGLAEFQPILRTLCDHSRRKIA